MKTENLFTPGCIRTFTGKYVNPNDTKNMEVCIEDIAHALSQQPRFGGHLPTFYSVAQHCVEVANMLPLEHKLAGLLHDASEAYLIDVPRPVKEILVNYKMIEDKVMGRISQEFGFEWPMHEAVKIADEYMLQAEWDALMLGKTAGRPLSLLLPLNPVNAEEAFLKLYNELK